MCLVTEMCLALCNPMKCEPNRVLWHWGFSRQEYQSGLLCPSPGDLPNPRMKPRSLGCQAVSLIAEWPAKPLNTEVGSLSLLQGIFLTQEQILDFIKLFFRIYRDDPTVFHFQVFSKCFILIDFQMFNECYTHGGQNPMDYALYILGEAATDQMFHSQL